MLAIAVATFAISFSQIEEQRSNFLNNEKEVVIRALYESLPNNTVVTEANNKWPVWGLSCISCHSIKEADSIIINNLSLVEQNGIRRLKFTTNAKDGRDLKYWHLTLLLNDKKFLPKFKDNYKKDEPFDATHIEVETCITNSSCPSNTQLYSNDNEIYATIPDTNNLIYNKNIRKGEIFVNSVVTTPNIIEKQQQVKITLKQNGITIKTKGEALNSGKKGDSIRVKILGSNPLNRSNNKTITTTAVAENEVIYEY